MFAAQDLRPGTFILAYLGRVHGGAASCSSGSCPGSASNSSSSSCRGCSSSAAQQSDYDLWLDRDAGLAVDAAREGNEGRFVNDYRGVRDRPNAEFGVAWCERWQQLCVGFWVVGGGARAASKGIRKGDEILVSYGKGFWQERAKEGRRDDDG
ncbi:hypothetical protein CDD83_8284 [Cordyceps sp. RAO-2017]|nr:hypothetical protein CDD83_8284 [Cordyceps sp. RAO-2017]